jgi:CheY-like chemotaxis protein
VCGLAFSGSEALKLAERYAPDVILMDINLIGEMDGIDVICQLGKRSKTPVVFISAYPADMVLERLSETEPYEYLVKPLRSNALQTAVEHILDRS